MIGMPKNYVSREKKLKARKQAMKVNARGLLTVILPTIAKRGREAREKESRRAR